MEDIFPLLHTQNPQQRFSNRAEDYAKYRPSYPTAAIDQILAGLDQPVAADIGAGTGISARLLADRGAKKVWAIEPNSAMYAVAKPHPHVEFQQGSAEQTGLASQSVDLITCCQAFHWFEPIATLAEFHRILQPAGRLALMWNERDQTDPFTQEHNEIIRVAADRQYFDSP
jgi:ubiquinone/menaquinone biosynthesis C-methylase UbiE